MASSRSRWMINALALAVLVHGALGCSDEGSPSDGEPEPMPPVADPIPEPPTGHPGFASPQVQSLALSPTLPELYVTNTPADTLDIIDTESREVIHRVSTGIDPVSVAVRPDGLEVWVSNHVSDTVSVIDVDPESVSRYRIVATIQAFDEDGQVTDFDEPTGIAFASNEKAYVALSSRNYLAVVDVPRRAVTKRVLVRAQEPRALTVRNDRLYVIPFESNNQTEFSGCLSVSAGPEGCTFEIIDTLLTNSIDAIITRGFPANIIRNPAVPDRDLFIYDTETDALVEEVSSIGTLLYGVAVDSHGRVFISQTEARNDDNGDAVAGDDLIDLDNRAFLNQVARLECAGGCSEMRLIELEPELPAQPAPGMALATPFGIQVSDDDAIVVSVAAGSSRLFTMDARTGEVLGRAAVGAIPKSLVLESDDDGAPLRAWVFNAIEDSVSLVDVSDPADPSETIRIPLEDPTDPVIKRGRIAFNDANGSTSGTYSCESCHPDGNTDQLLWNLGAKCITEGCDQKIPRTTMPIRGLRDTLPLHWDGVVGDPFGGINGEVVDSGIDAEPTCTDEHSCFRDLVDGAMSGTMCDLNACPTDQNELGLAGAFDEADRDAMAEFLKTVPYPPARSRKTDDTLSALAADGLRVFMIGDDAAHPGCSRSDGACHGAPFWAGTNTPRQGYDAPTFRGLTDRWLLLPNGRSGMWDFVSRDGFNEVPWNPNDGPDELYSWGLTFGTEILPIANRNSTGRGPFELFQLFEETSTGFAGTFGRQVTLNATTADEAQTVALLERMESAAGDGVVDLRANGYRTTGEELVLLYREGAYTTLDENGEPAGTMTHTELTAAARDGALAVTLTARLGPAADAGTAQPAIWLPRAFEGPARDSFLQEIPKVSGGERSVALFGRHLDDESIVLVDGRAVEATLTCASGGSFPSCDGEEMTLELEELPTAGDHTLQIATPRGLLSNELLLIVE